MKKLFWLICIFYLICTEYAYSSSIKIVYPTLQKKIHTSSAFIVGSVKKNSSLIINDEPVEVFPSGSFVKVVPLDFGENKFHIKSTLNNKCEEKEYSIYRTEKYKNLPKNPLKIDKNSIYPNEILILNPNDTIKVRFQGASSNQAFFTIGNKKISMRELSTLECGQKGIYQGFYKIEPDDNFQNTPIKVFLKNGTTTISQTATGLVTTVPASQAILVKNKNTSTIRKTPNGERLSPLAQNTVFTINASVGDFYRAPLTNDFSFWIEKKDVEILSEYNIKAQSDLMELNIYSDKKYTYLSIPLENRIPVLLNHPEPNKLRIDIYGATKNFIMDEYKDEDVKSLKIIEPQPNKLSFLLEMQKTLFGYDYYFQKNEFILRLKKPPKVDKKRPLQNICIALDAGHGGKDSGAIGPTCIQEKDINLAIVKYLKKELENAGAKVILTRDKDITLSIFSRPEIAKEAHADILLSIHNNALPDGENPYNKHGAGVYYFQSQSKELAEKIQNSIIENIEIKNDGIFERSFVLTRPSEMPAVLIECGYMINPIEYEMLIDETYQKAFATAIKKGLEDFFISQQQN